MRGPVKLSVAVITYNHERFIAQALDSILAQETGFDFEIVVGDDCSTDNTRRIVLDYEKKHPDVIRTFLPETNVGMMRNCLETHRLCRGKYVALLEGDDYWVSTNKLQTQVDLLENHPDCSLCFHPTRMVFEDGSPDQRFVPLEKRDFYTIADLLESRCKIGWGSVVFRNNLFREFPAWTLPLAMADIPLFLLAADQGRLAYIDLPMSVYRIHAGGVWSSGHQQAEWAPEVARKKLLASIECYETVNKHLDYKYDRLIRAKISRFYYDMVWTFQREGNASGMRRCLIKAFRTLPFHSQIPLKFACKSFILAFAPFALKLYRLRNA